MFLVLIRRELLANLMTFRFVVAMVVTLSLVVANTVVLIADYERRLASYNTAVQQHAQKVSEAETYSEVERKIRVDRPPKLNIPMLSREIPATKGTVSWAEYPTEEATVRQLPKSKDLGL